MATQGKHDGLTRRFAWAAAGALTIGLMLSGPAVAAGQTSSGPAGSAVTVQDGPYCPGEAPVGARYLYSYVQDGRHVDVYLVPFHDGWQMAEVVCD